jgi:hypothetical protein
MKMLRLSNIPAETGTRYLWIRVRHCSALPDLFECMSLASQRLDMLAMSCTSLINWNIHCMVLRREQTPSTAVTEPTSPLTRLSGSGHRGRLKKEAVPPFGRGKDAVLAKFYQSWRLSTKCNSRTDMAAGCKTFSNTETVFSVTVRCYT